MSKDIRFGAVEHMYNWAVRGIDRADAGLSSESDLEVYRNCIAVMEQMATAFDHYWRCNEQGWWYLARKEGEQE